MYKYVYLPLLIQIIESKNIYIYLVASYSACITKSRTLKPIHFLFMTSTRKLLNASTCMFFSYYF